MSMPNIPPSVPPRTRLADIAAEPGRSETRSAGGPDLPDVPPTGDQVMLSDSAALTMGDTLAAKNPPFDLQTVTRIKEAIAEGRYPIDTKAIAESLFAGFSEMIL